SGGAGRRLPAFPTRRSSDLVAAAAAGFGGRGGLAPGAGLGAAAGVLYAAGDVGTKAAVAGGGRLAFVPVLLVCHGLAFVALQLRSEEHTSELPSRGQLVCRL